MIFIKIFLTQFNIAVFISQEILSKLFLRVFPNLAFKQHINILVFKCFSVPPFKSSSITLHRRVIELLIRFWPLIHLVLNSIHNDSTFDRGIFPFANLASHDNFTEQLKSTQLNINYIKINSAFTISVARLRILFIFCTQRIWFSALSCSVIPSCSASCLMRVSYISFARTSTS